MKQQGCDLPETIQRRLYTMCPPPDAAVDIIDTIGNPASS
jgi:hypothetical protein